MLYFTLIVSLGSSHTSRSNTTPTTQLPWTQLVLLATFTINLETIQAFASYQLAPTANKIIILNNVLNHTNCLLPNGTSIASLRFPSHYVLCFISLHPFSMSRRYE